MRLVALLIATSLVGFMPFVQAQTHQQTRSALTDAAVGVKTRNGEVLFASPVVGFDGYDDGLKRLLMLLLLKSNPDAFLNQANTLAYTTFVDAGRRQSYVTENGQWRGRDQFERDDTRAAFIKNERSAIFALIPSLPLTFVELRPFGFGDYDRATGTLAIGFDNHDPVPVGPWAMPRPYTFPTSWQVPEETARQLVRLQTERRTSRTEQITAAARYVLRDLRFIEGKVVLDLAALDITIYGSRRLDSQIASIPLPAFAVRAARPTAERSMPLLDPIFPRLLVAKSRTDLLSNNSFIGETFRIRRQAEFRIAKGSRHNGFDEATNWPAFMSATMLNTNAVPSDGDLRSFRTWMEQAIPSVADTVRFDRICGYAEPASGKPRRCVVNAASRQPGKTNFRLHDVLNFSALDWGYAGGAGDWVAPARKAASDRIPGSTNSWSLPSGNDVPTIIVASANPAWFEFAAPFDLVDIASLSMDLTIKRSEIIPDAAGKAFQLIELDPKALNYRTHDGVEKSLPIEPAGTVTSTNNAGKFDVLGVKLGMPLKEAVQVLGSNIDLGMFKRTDENRPNDPVFTSALAFDLRPLGESRVQKVSLYYDRALPHQPIVAVGRYFALKEQNFRDNESATRSIIGSVTQKVGAYDQGDFKRNEEFYWATNSTTKAVLKSGMSYTHRCSHSMFGNFFEPPGSDSMFRSGHVAVGCGEMLSVKVNREYMAFFLFNGDVVDEMRRIAAAQDKPAQPAQPAPPIKF